MDIPGRALPPHARGCTLDSVQTLPVVRASPARAGMYPRSPAPSPPGTGFPRTRGDVPLSAPAPVLAEGLPPHARGCTGNDRRSRCQPRASPARAGMYRARSIRGAVPTRFPRTRGDVPQGFMRSKGDHQLPPHARGCTLKQNHFRLVQPASPARAGMYPNCRSPDPTTPSFPRTRGDVPVWDARWRTHFPLPPHARGCTGLGRPLADAFSASPARAGMYLPCALVRSRVVGFPRTRGDVPPRRARGAAAVRLPPHARGCTRQRGRGGRAFRASPARAGMYPMEW